MSKHSLKLEEDGIRKKLEDELKFFRARVERWLSDKNLAGKFVAIKDHQIIDSDSDDFRLARKIEAQFPSQVVLIVKVEKEIPEYELSSPELV